MNLLKGKIKLIKVIIIYLLFVAATSVRAQQTDSPKLTGPYLGQKPPELTPVVFTSETLSTNKYPHSHLTFDKDGKTIYWSAYPKGKSNQTIFFSTYDGKNLTFPLKAPFAADSGNGGPVISYDGKCLFFSAELSSINSASRKPFAICYVEKIDGMWGKPIIIESTVDTLVTKGQVSVAKSGNIYFSGRVYSERLPSIFVCTKEGDKFLHPEKVKGKLAEAGLISDPWVDPEEKFMLLSIQPEQGPPMRTDIGISYRESDNTWSKPVRIKGEINTDHFERFPSLSPDGKFLFFIRSSSERFVGEGAHFYWVSTNIVEELQKY